MNAVLKPEPQMIRYEAACRALAEAKAVDEVQDVRSKADAMRIYGMQAKNKSLEVDAAEIRIRAERRLGELLAEQKAGDGLNRGAVGHAGPGRGNKNVVVTHDRVLPTLAEAGISKDLSSRAQKLAAVPKAEFEAEVGEWRDRVQAEHARVTTRLESAGERELAKAPTAREPLDKARDHAKKQNAVIRALRADVAARDAEIESLKGDLAETRANAAEMADSLQAYMTAEEGVEKAAKEIKRLTAQIRVIEATRDQYMTQNAEMKRSLAAKDRKIAKLEGKP
jgi:DNA repair exonuclease SbcCD ATPase subunit